MNRRILALVLALCMMISAAPVCAGAADGQQVTANAVTVTAGNTATVTLKAENFSNIAALDIYVYYDAQAFTVSGTSNGNMLSGAQASVNTATAGEIKISAMALNGINGTGTLMTVRFTTQSTCAPGTYPITVAVGRAYDGNLAAATVGSINGSVTVNKPVQTEYFNISSSVNKSTLQKDDVLSYTLQNSGSRAFVSGDFTVTYDHTVFAFESLELAAGLKGEGAVYSVNSSVLGQVRLTYAATDPTNSYNLFTLKLKVIADQDGSAGIKTQATNMYRADLSMYLPASTSRNLTLKKIPEVMDYPNAFLTTQELVVGRQNSSVFALEAGAGVAAADFTLRYDPTVLKCLQVAADEGVAEIGGMLVINDNYDAGTIRFSYINMEAYAEADIPLIHILWEPLQSPEEHYEISVSSVGVVDAEQNPVTLEHVTDTGCIFVRTVIPPVCLVDGRTNFTCACGESYDIEPVEKLGHDLTYVQAREETCTEIGWDAYEYCNRCDYTTYVEIPALDHDYIHHDAKAPTCLDIGWYAYDTCGRCDYTTYVELPALGHRVKLDRTEWVEPIQVTNAGSIPFVFTDGVYYSNNHTDSSSSEFTLTTLYDCTLEFIYGVSSESGCDRLIIYQNNTQKVNVAGETSNLRLILNLKPGDVVRVRYQKDGSVSRGQDMGWVELVYDLHSIPSFEDVPAESQNPDCTNAVVCSYCDTVIKEALDHDYIHHDAKDPTCTEIGWYAYDTCGRCDYTTYVELPALDHDYIHHDAKDPTCLDIGWYAYDTCGRCDYTTYVELPALGHDYIHHDAKNPTCTEIGWYAYDTCGRCDYTTYVEIPALDHDYIHHDAKAPTCTEMGWHAYDTCGRCDYTTYVELPALDHDYIHHDAKDPTCTEIGWYAYDTCGRCAYTTYVELPALGHRVTINNIQVTNQGSIPFTFSDGVYYSNNHTDGSSSEFTVTAARDYVLEIIYGVSSEQNYDKLFILHNGTQKAVISGEVTEQYLSLSLTAGDVVTIRYRKDASVSRGQDMGWVALLGGNWDVPAESQNPDCTNAVVCSYCDTVIKEALGHDVIHHDAQAVTCLEIGWDAYDTCGRCDYTTYVEIPALDHDYIYHNAQAVTCLEIGWDAYQTCSRCDYSTYNEIPALGHDYIHHDAKDPTCTEIGWNAYDTCGRCDYTTYVELPALDHDYIHHDAKDPTCTEIGWYAYDTCGRCDYTTYAEIPANGHSFMDKVCIVCGVAQPATRQWDLSVNGDGTVMAYAYAHMDGTYLIEIVGNGPTKNHSSSPFYSLSGKIDDVVIGDGVTTIGNRLFRDVSIRGNVQIANSVTAIGEYAFYNFSGPKTVTLPAGVTSIGNYAFYEAKNLLVILLGNQLPGSLGSIWDHGCGYYLQPQQVITTEDAVYVIDRNGKAWFAKYCKDETEFVAETEVNGIPVTGIGAYAFYRKQKLRTYTISAQINTVDTYAFRDSENIVLFLEGTTTPSGLGTVSYDRPSLYKAPQKVIQMTDRLYVLDQNGQMHFAHYWGFEKIVTVDAEIEGVPVRHIGDLAFAETSVQTVLLPDTVETIGAYAFIHSTVKQVYLPDSLTKIGTWGFFGADLDSITIPQNVTTIDASTFSYCDHLKVVYVKSPTIAKGIKSATSWGDLCKYAETVVIPADVENSWLPGAYAYREEAQLMDMDCVIYSNCVHDWQQTVISELVTCQTDGVIQFACQNCGVEKVQITPCHDVISHAASTPTCTQVGWEAYETCSRCEHSTYVEIPALGHDYSVSFSWSDDHAACQAQFICTRDCGREETVICAVSDDVTDPTQTVHTASVIFDGTEYTDTVSCDNYQVTFQDWDGSCISEAYYHYGRPVTTPADPERTADDLYTYTFAGWDKAVVDCNGDATYTAVYTAELRCVYGDATGDGVVDGLDVIRLKRYLANYNYETGTANVEIALGADANGDGVIDGLDVIRLKRYLANYNYETGESTIPLGPQ